MKRVTGIGGVFFKSEDPEKLYGWYERHLDIRREDPSSAVFHWRHKEEPDKPGMTVWSIFKHNSGYFGNADARCMFNYRVDNLDTLLVELEKEGVWIDPKRENLEYGKFAWIQDPDGNRIELWQPPAGG